MSSALNVSSWSAGLRGLRSGAGASGRRKPGVARRSAQVGLSTTHPLRGDEIRAIKVWLVERARMKAPPGRSFLLSERRQPLHRSTVNLLLHKYGEKGSPPRCHSSPHAAPCLRLCSRRSGREHTSHSGLSRAPQYSAHRALHRHQPGKVREVVEVGALPRRSVSSQPPEGDSSSNVMYVMTSRASSVAAHRASSSITQVPVLVIMGNIPIRRAEAPGRVSPCSLAAIYPVPADYP